jgi:lysophospholipase
MTDALLHRRSLPPDGLPLFLAMDDGWQVRTIDWPGDDGRTSERGSILFVNGRGDFIEKYAETYWHWRTRGFAVSAFDWRGQGLSGRIGDDPMKGDCLGFDPWLADLDAIVDRFLTTQPPPWYVVAHSMGGHLLLRHLEAHAAAGTARPFRRAVLLAPMLGITAGPLGQVWLERFARAAARLGLGADYAPMQRVTPEQRKSAARQMILTSDVARFSDEGWWVEQNPALSLGGVTNRWLLSAFASTAALSAAGVVEKVATPTLVMIAEHERLVDNVLTTSLEARMPDAVIEQVAGGAHELLRERDAIRAAVLARIDAFLVP